MVRLPDEYKKPVSERNSRKWDKVITLFLENRMVDLVQNQRTGTRGRILSTLALDLFNVVSIPYKDEPIFYCIEPKIWYVDFARRHNIKLRIHDFYNPDLFLEDGTWVEITLSENTAYKKVFRYGHQANKLQVFWLDSDNGFHKKMCQSICFPNAEVKSIECFNHELKKIPGGLEIISKLKALKELKGKVL